MELHPSGEQHEIAFADQRAMVTEVGATLREYSVGDRAILDGFPAAELCSGARGQVLLPWPNRIRDGAYKFAGHRQQLALSEPERHNASHGLVRWSPWRLVERSWERVRLGLTLHPQPGYPFLLDLAVEYLLDADGLRVTTSARNRGTDAAPFGAGSHPYLKPRGALEGARLRIPARTYLEVDERLLPTGRRLPVEGSPYDFRRPRPIDATMLDTCFTDFTDSWIELDGTRLWWDGSHRFVQVFSGDTLSPVRRRQGLAVEPLSCPADAFNSTAGLVVLEPGKSWSGSWGIELPADNEIP